MTKRIPINTSSRDQTPYVTKPTSPQKIVKPPEKKSSPLAIYASAAVCAFFMRHFLSLIVHLPSMVEFSNTVF